LKSNSKIVGGEGGANRVNYEYDVEKSMIVRYLFLKRMQEKMK